MAKKKDKKDKQEPTKKGSSVVSRSIVSEMRESYLDYAMSVITARALPDVRDGLKPVHRRILYTMHELGLRPGGKTRKCAKITGDVTGNYHPHGDVAVYDSLTKLAQDFSMRYPLVIGQGNFGSLDGDAPAAARYTEAKMSALSVLLLADIEKETVNFRSNYEGTRTEPVVLPAAVPNLLLNGTLGIAVGMATNIPPHNLREVIDATVHLIDNPDADTEDLLQFVKGPDFPIGGVIYDKKAIHQAYANGKGGIVCRGQAEIVEVERGGHQIVISSLPFRVNKADLVAKIADLVRAKKIDGVKGLRDESSDDVRVVVDLKNTAHPQKVLNSLYKHTQLEDTFHLNMVALSEGVPQTMSLKDMLAAFVTHRAEVIKRRTEFDLQKARDREHILLGLTTALDHIDEIVALIKKASDVETAHAGLRKKYKLSDKQATAILEMRLQKLAGLERKKIEDELKDIQKLIKELSALLKSKKKMLDVIKSELSDISDKHGDDRRTKVIAGAAGTLSTEDLIPDEESLLVLTAGGYIKRTNPREYRRQRRGGVGVIDINTKDEDFVTTFLTASTHSDLLFFTDRGKVYQCKMYDVPEGRRATKGKSVMNFLSLASDERVTSVLAMPKGVKKEARSLFMVTKHGMAKKVAAKHFADVRRSGLIAIKLKGDDELVSAQFLSGKDTVIVVTNGGKAIRFKQSEVRTMGRTAAGVRGIKLAKNDEVVAARVVDTKAEGAELLVITEKGYGKKTAIKEYKVQKRGGLGVKAANITDKTGRLIMAHTITEDVEEVVAISKKGQVVRIAIKEIPTQGRATQGVRIMKLREADGIASLVCL